MTLIMRITILCLALKDGDDGEEENEESSD